MAMHSARPGPSEGDVSEVHVLVLTSYGDPPRALDPQDDGAEAYLLTHAEPEAILRGIREVVAGGSPLDPGAARALADARRGGRAALTEREREVLGEVVHGLPNKEIASRLGITERTVKAHLTRAFQRIGVTNRTQAALWGQRHLA